MTRHDRAASFIARMLGFRPLGGLHGAVLFFQRPDRAVSFVGGSWQGRVVARLVGIRVETGERRHYGSDGLALMRALLAEQPKLLPAPPARP